MFPFSAIYGEVSDEGCYAILCVCRGAEPQNKLYYCYLEKLDYKIEGENELSQSLNKIMRFP